MTQHVGMREIEAIKLFRAGENLFRDRNRCCDQKEEKKKKARFR